MKFKELIICKCFLKDLKSIQRKCKNLNLKDELIKFFINSVKDEDLIHNIPKLYEGEYGLLFKSRFKDCSGKGKRSGLRIIWGITKNQEKLIFVKIYSKSQIENIPTNQLVNELIKCIITQDFERMSP